MRLTGLNRTEMRWLSASMGWNSFMIKYDYPDPDTFHQIGLDDFIDFFFFFLHKKSYTVPSVPPQTKHHGAGNCSFAVLTPRLWNNLPPDSFSWARWPFKQLKNENCFQAQVEETTANKYKSCQLMISQACDVTMKQIILNRWSELYQWTPTGKTGWHEVWVLGPPFRPLFNQTSKMWLHQHVTEDKRVLSSWLLVIMLLLSSYIYKSILFWILTMKPHPNISAEIQYCKSWQNKI